MDWLDWQQRNWNAQRARDRAFKRAFAKALWNGPIPWSLARQVCIFSEAIAIDAWRRLNT